MEILNNQNPNIMKHVFLLLAMIMITMTATAQKKMALIEGMTDQTIDVIANVRIANEKQAIIISQNNRDTYEVTHDDQLEVGVQYYFVLKVETCDGCDIKKADIRGFFYSPRETYNRIDVLKRQFNLKPNDD